MKARLQTILFTALSVVALFTVVTYTSCNQDKCKSIACANNGVCIDGNCQCPGGYEGPQCETVNRARFIGTWVVTENGSITDAAQYPVSVEPGDAINEIRIKNMRNNIVEYVSAYVKHDTLTIPLTTVTNGVYSYTVIGSGILTYEKYYGVNGKLTVRYKVTDNNTGLVDDFGYDGGDASLWNK